jgi:hypothetical protein
VDIEERGIMMNDYPKEYNGQYSEYGFITVDPGSQATWCIRLNLEALVNAGLASVEVKATEQGVRRRWWEFWW